MDAAVRAAPGVVPGTVRELQRSECLARLRGRRVGRAAFATGGLLTVVPTPFHLVGGFVTFPAGRLEAAIGQVVTFECDDLEDACPETWSVCVTGQTERGAAGEVRLAATLLRGSVYEDASWGENGGALPARRPTFGPN